MQRLEPQLRWGDSVVLGIIEMDEEHFPKAERALSTVPGAIQYSAKCFPPIWATSTSMGQIVPVVRILVRPGGTTP